jgi:hypothetical protein
MRLRAKQQTSGIGLNSSAREQRMTPPAFLAISGNFYAAA